MSASLTEDELRMLATTLIEALSLVLVAVVLVDATLTVLALIQFAQMAASVTQNANQHMDAFVSDVMERRTAAVETLEREREKFSREALAARMGDMSQIVSSAARRVRHFASPDEHLEKLWGALRR